MRNETGIQTCKLKSREQRVNWPIIAPDMFMILKANLQVARKAQICARAPSEILSK